MKGQFRLAQQRGDWGYYGLVVVEVEVVVGRGVRVVFQCEELRWRAGVEFGLAYAYERTIGDSFAATVYVTELLGHEVDTTEVVMAYVAANSFFDAMKVERPAHLSLEESAGVFKFPK